MAIELQGLRTVIYPVADLAAAKEWWAGLLGEQPYFDEAFYVGFNVAGYELGLLPGQDPADGALTYWGVESVDDAVSAATGAGAEVHTPASEVGGGIITATVRVQSVGIVGFIHNPNFSLP